MILPSLLRRIVQGLGINPDNRVWAIGFADTRVCASGESGSPSVELQQAPPGDTGRGQKDSSTSRQSGYLPHSLAPNLYWSFVEADGQWRGAAPLGLCSLALSAG